MKRTAGERSRLSLPIRAWNDHEQRRRNRARRVGCGPGTLVTLVIDASVVVAALVDGGPDGRWAEAVLLSDHLAAPHLMPVEVANVLRRVSLSGEVSADVASLAHADLEALRVELFPYVPLAGRAWELRENLTLYDAWYVATAELTGAKLATLDRRLAKAAGPRCEFLLPSRR